MNSKRRVSQTNNIRNKLSIVATLVQHDLDKIDIPSYNTTYNRYGDNCQLFVDRLWWLISQKTETQDIWKLVGAKPVGTKADRLKLYRNYGVIMDQGATVAVNFNKTRQGGQSITSS